jgi:hypothetical protein
LIYTTQKFGGKSKTYKATHCLIASTTHQDKEWSILCSNAFENNIRRSLASCLSGIMEKWQLSERLGGIINQQHFHLIPDIQRLRTYCYSSKLAFPNCGLNERIIISTGSVKVAFP